MVLFQSLVIPDKFQHILRIMNTNIDGKRKVMFAMTAIKGVGRRYSNIVLKKADIDLDKRAGECTEEEVRIYLYSHHLEQVVNRLRSQVVCLAREIMCALWSWSSGPNLTPQPSCVS